MSQADNDMRGWHGMSPRATESSGSGNESEHAQAFNISPERVQKVEKIEHGNRTLNELIDKARIAANWAANGGNPQTDELLRELASALELMDGHHKQHDEEHNQRKIPDNHGIQRTKEQEWEECYAQCFGFLQQTVKEVRRLQDELEALRAPELELVEVEDIDAEIAIAEAIQLMPHDTAYEDKGEPVLKYLKNLGYRITKSNKP